MYKGFPKTKIGGHIRCASLLRKIYLHGPLGIADLKVAYGGRKRIGYNLAHHQDSSGAIIRNALHQLEASGYIVGVQHKGRTISSEGMKKMDRLATEIHKEPCQDCAPAPTLRIRVCLTHNPRNQMMRK